MDRIMHSFAVDSIFYSIDIHINGMTIEEMSFSDSENH